MLQCQQFRLIENHKTPNNENVYFIISQLGHHLGVNTHYVRRVHVTGDIVMYLRGQLMRLMVDMFMLLLLGLWGHNMHAAQM